MRQLSLEQIENLDSGEIVPAFTARIKKVFPQKKGENAKGDWYLQNMIVTDGDKELTVTWCEEDRFDKWEGREMIFESSDTTHGKQGLKWEVRKVGDKTYSGVKITGAAKIREVSPDQTPAAKQAEIREQGNWQERAEILIEDRAPIGDSIDEVRANTMRAVNGFAIALEAMRLISEQYERDNLGSALTPEHKQAITSSIFIYLDRKGLIARLPTTQMPGRGAPKTAIQSVREEAGRLVDKIRDEGVLGHE